MATGEDEVTCTMATKDTLDVEAFEQSQDKQAENGEFDTKDESKLRGMSKTHYAMKSERKCCYNPSCRKKFSLTIRPRHCRRCGEVFCMKCLRYQRRLNGLARPDPEGKSRKVCAQCYEEDVFSLGCTRSVAQEFVALRQEARENKIEHQRANSLTTTFWRDQMDIGAECQRLLKGFGRKMGSSESKAALHELKTLVNVPSWQKSTYWPLERLAGRCRACTGSLGLRKHRRYCKVCGLALCKKCSHKELLVYLPEGKGQRSTSPDMDMRPQPKLAVIKVDGCPDKEPDMSMLLHVCGDCKQDLEGRQRVNPAWFEEDGHKKGLVGNLVVVDVAFTELQDELTKTISQYERLIDDLETRGQDNGIYKSSVKQKHRDKRPPPVRTDEDRAATSPETNILVLQGNIERTLNNIEVHFHGLKPYDGLVESRTQKLLLQNYTKGKYDFFMDNKYNFRHLTKRWRTLTP